MEHADCTGEGFLLARTSRDVRLESVMRTKADVRQRLRIYEFSPPLPIGEGEHWAYRRYAPLQRRVMQLECYSNGGFDGFIS
jgi:hypothetical protein